MAQRISEDEVAIMIDMVNNGSLLKDVASYIGCSVSSVQLHCALRGVKTSYELKGIRFIENVRRMQGEGKKLSEVAEYYGVSDKSISHRLWRLRQQGYNAPYFQESRNKEQEERFKQCQRQ